VDGMYHIIGKQRDQDLGYTELNTGCNPPVRHIPIIGELYVRSGNMSGYNLSWTNMWLALDEQSRVKVKNNQEYKAV
jgi:hypothetical protein